MAIYGFVGLIGSGKTYNAVQFACELARQKRAIVASFIKIEPPAGVEFRHLTLAHHGLDEAEILALVDEASSAGRGVVLLVDEVGIILPSRFFHETGRELMFLLSQSRKLADGRGVDIVWTAQDIEQVDAFLRRLTQWVYHCRAVYVLRKWFARPRFFYLARYRPVGVANGSGKKGRRLGWEVKLYSREWERRYDTFEIVRPPAAAIEKDRLRRTRPPRRGGVQGTGPIAEVPSSPEAA